jgi:hypothetical protein
MQIFVTGGSGFVGGHLLEALAAQGHSLHALARSDASARLVQGYGATPVRADLGDIQGEHLRGAEAVIHCAARAEEWGTRAQFWEANVRGTERVLAAAREAGVRRFIHVGTEAAVFDGHDLVDIDETYPYPKRQRYLYSESKAEAERLVLGANSEAMTTLSIRPRLVWGPRDSTVLPAIVRMARAGSFAWLDGGRALTSTTHVRNVVHALGLSLRAGRGGAAYFVADDGQRTIREFLTALSATQGVTLPARSIPGALARPLSALVEGAYRLVGAKATPPMTRFAIAMMSRTVTVRCDRARAELGYAPVISVDEGLAQLRQAQPAG